VPWDNRPLINARGETLATRSAFKRLLTHRVLIPASLWWEWQKGDGGAKTKTRIRPSDGGLFAFAGLVDGDRFTMVTTTAAPSVAHVHDRMPVVLPAEAEAAWLDPEAPFEEAAAALAPFGGALDAAADIDPPKQPRLF